MTTEAGLDASCLVSAVAACGATGTGIAVGREPMARRRASRVLASLVAPAGATSALAAGAAISAGGRAVGTAAGAGAGVTGCALTTGATEGVDAGAAPLK